MLEYGLAFARVRVNLQVCGVKLQIQPVAIFYLQHIHLYLHCTPEEGLRVWRSANTLQLKTCNSQSFDLQIFFQGS